jgi:hypothetical protein
MAAITKSEIVELAFTRNVSTEHILDADISTAKKMYVDAYIDDVTEASAIYDTYVKPVIAFGVAVNIFNRIAAEITDRGVVQMVTDGATTLDADSKQKMLGEFTKTLDSLIFGMIEAADDADMDFVQDWDSDDFQLIGFSGIEKSGRL